MSDSRRSLDALVVTQSCVCVCVRFNYAEPSVVGGTNAERAHVSYTCMCVQSMTWTGRQGVRPNYFSVVLSMAKTVPGAVARTLRVIFAACAMARSAGDMLLTVMAPPLRKLHVKKLCIDLAAPELRNVCRTARALVCS